MTASRETLKKRTQKTLGGLLTRAVSTEVFMVRYVFMFAGGVVTILYMVGAIFAAFHSEPKKDYIEEALEEVTRKRKRK